MEWEIQTGGERNFRQNVSANNSPTHFTVLKLESRFYIFGLRSGRCKLNAHLYWIRVHIRENVAGVTSERSEYPEAVASSSGHMTNKLCSWNWKYFFRISDPNRDLGHVENLMVFFQWHYLSCCHISSKSVHWFLSYLVNEQTDRERNKKTSRRTEMIT